MRSSTADAGDVMPEHRGEYGYDGSFHTVSAGTQLAAVGAGSAALLAGSGVFLKRGNRAAAALAALSAVEIVGTAAWYIYATRSGKFRVWDGILDELELRGDETLLDLGCGRGAVLLAAAKRLPRGRAIGVDLWQADQTDNSAQATLANAELEGVTDRVELHTADMTELPLPDESVDVIVSSLAIHNIPTRAGRRLALDQRFACCGPAGDSPSRTCGRPVNMRRGCASWAGETCGGATSGGAWPMAAPGSPPAW